MNAVHKGLKCNFHVAAHSHELTIKAVSDTVHTFYNRDSSLKTQ